MTNRDEGGVTVLDLPPEADGHLAQVAPDMAGPFTDGDGRWLSDRYHDEVYVISTRDGRLPARIPVGRGPYGLTIWPQPGRYFLGPTASIR